MTDRWTTIISEKLNKRCGDTFGNIEVINSGVGGNTSREALARIDKDVIAYEPDIVLVEFGGNDVTDVTYELHREVSLYEFRMNINEIYNKIVAADARMVLLTFTPVIDDWHFAKSHTKYVLGGGQDNCIEPYRQCVRKFASEKGLLLIDTDIALRRACSEYSTEKIIIPDGVHLTKEGNKIIAESVFQNIISLLSSNLVMHKGGKVDL
jgi:lysophospholipase L1-like esterase